jgi:hypothetical protein
LMDNHAVATIALVPRSEEDEDGVSEVVKEETTTAEILEHIHKPTVLEFDTEPADEETETINDLMADSY